MKFSFYSLIIIHSFFRSLTKPPSEKFKWNICVSEWEEWICLSLLCGDWWWWRWQLKLARLQLLPLESKDPSEQWRLSLSSSLSLHQTDFDLTIYWISLWSPELISSADDEDVPEPEYAGPEPPEQGSPQPQCWPAGGHQEGGDHPDLHRLHGRHPPEQHPQAQHQAGGRRGQDCLQWGSGEAMRVSEWFGATISFIACRNK